MAPEDFAELTGRARRHGAAQRARARTAATTLSLLPAPAASADDDRADPRQEPQFLTHGVSATPCGTWRGVRRHRRRALRRPDQIDAASNTGIDNMREILDTRVRSDGRPYKVYLIDEVHMLSKSRVQLDAQDARGAAPSTSSSCSRRRIRRRFR